jgi:hypothetical protein
VTTNQEPLVASSAEPDSTSDYIPVRAAAERTVVSIRTERRWAAEGKVGIQPGQHGRVVRLADVKRHLPGDAEAMPQEALQKSTEGTPA